MNMERNHEKGAFDTGNKLRTGIDGQALTKTHITTWTHRVIDIDAPRPEAICMEDVAHGLSMHVRWAGQGRWLSVAQHCVAVVRLLEQGGEEVVPLRLVRAALMHDAHEAYIGDLSGGLKYLLGDSDLKSIINQLDWAIEVATPNLDFSLEKHEHAMLKACEERLVEIEFDVLFKGDSDMLLEGPLCQRLAEELFLNEAARLGMYERRVSRGDN